MKLNAKAMDILMAELEQNQMWVIFLMGLGKAMPATVTKFDLTKIIAVLCKHLNWIENETGEKRLWIPLTSILMLRYKTIQ